MPQILEVCSDNIKAGQVTFNAEGNNVKGSRYYSRVIHWPGNAESGVTIGRGYDMGNRNRQDVFTDMTKAGISNVKAKLLSLGAGLKGSNARDFVHKNAEVIGEITMEEQVCLFNNIYPDYVDRTKLNYMKWTSSSHQKKHWSQLDKVVKDILVHFVYQGFTKGPNPMQAGMNNRVSDLIQYIESSVVMKSYESGRNRIAYLRKYGKHQVKERALNEN